MISGILVLTLLACSCASPPPADAPPAQAEPSGPLVMDLDFNPFPLGELRAPWIRNQGLYVVPMALSSRLQVVDNAGIGGKALRVTYPAGQIGPAASGGLFVVNLPPSDEYYLSYRVLFEDGFDFAKGGKIPGLSSGGAVFSGGNIPDEGQGWSARMAWGGDRSLSLYLYWCGQASSQCGDTLHLRKAFLTPGVWHSIVQRVKINAPNQADAVIQVWFDGQLKFAKENFQLRSGDLGRADSFLFSTFPGGSTLDFAPAEDCHAQFDRFQVTTLPPPGIETVD